MNMLQHKKGGCAGYTLHTSTTLGLFRGRLDWLFAGPRVGVLLEECSLSELTL